MADELYPIAVLIDELKDEEVAVSWHSHSLPIHPVPLSLAC